MDKKNTPYQRISCDTYDEYERMAVQKKNILFMLMDGFSIQEVEGKIKTLETKEKVEYMILESGKCFRLDEIVSWTEL